MGSEEHSGCGAALFAADEGLAFAGHDGLVDRMDVEGDRRAYRVRLTPKGRKQLDVETSKWEKLARAIARVLRPA